MQRRVRASGQARERLPKTAYEYFHVPLMGSYCEPARTACLKTRVQFPGRARAERCSGGRSLPVGDNIRNSRGLFALTMGTAIPSSGKWGCPIVTRQIIRRVIEMVGVPKYYGSLQFNIGWQFCLPDSRLCLTQLIDDGNFGRKREKAGNYRPTKGKKEKRKKREREKDPWRRMVYGYGHRSFSLVSFFVLLHHRPPAGSR
ncbi:hypothetical protein ALC60_03580 [Trachymyrmex zeteki]|uniref:Uncharacterized protein n=1 Tax=Mycetomoellerius zeteki TaxID=64791 RepID=A0A151XBE7_9HYME|nr:hypothetical protein ALC60_03580 [Trachymyrmex zeteki]